MKTFEREWASTLPIGIRRAFHFFKTSCGFQIDFFRGDQSVSVLVDSESEIIKMIDEFKSRSGRFAPDREEAIFRLARHRLYNSAAELIRNPSIPADSGKTYSPVLFVGGVADGRTIQVRDDSTSISFARPDVPFVPADFEGGVDINAKPVAVINDVYEIDRLRTDAGPFLRLAHLKGTTVPQTLLRIFQFYADNAKPEQDQNAPSASHSDRFRDGSAAIAR